MITAITILYIWVAVVTWFLWLKISHDRTSR